MFNHLKLAALAATRIARQMVRDVESGLWRARWMVRNLGSQVMTESLGDVDALNEVKITVVSLLTRTDRRTSFSRAMQSFGHTTFEFMDAIDGREKFPNLRRHKAATKGCSESHKLSLEQFTPAHHRAVMVCEDDIEFLRNREDINSLLAEFLKDSRLDVLCLSARVRGSRLQISERLSIATRIVTGACYVVKPHAVSVLVKVFRESSERVSSGRRKAALDQHWHKVQTGKLFFAVPNKKSVKIVAGYSDIQGKFLPDVI